MNFIAYDLGTGGVKASLYDSKFNTLSKSFIEYETFYSGNNLHEQHPLDWWNGVAKSTKKLLKEGECNPKTIGAVALSGHSLVTVPIGFNGDSLLKTVPIWSDRRAVKQSSAFFKTIDETDWYMTTGNGFPSPLYSIFKLMWLKENYPEIIKKTNLVLGSKDFINYMLTGKCAIDHSYASGTGCYNLTKGCFEDRFLYAAGISADLFPPIMSSHDIVGRITAEAAKATGLAEGTVVACGGVDNACMALGAAGSQNGSIYVSLGSSSWIPVNSNTPVLDPKTKPYVFRHIENNMYTSAYSIFAGGSSLRWVRDTLCKDLARENIYTEMDRLASTSPVGANGIIFNPCLAGGTSQDKSFNIKGGFFGLHLGTTREDMIRAAMEGIALNLRISLDNLKTHTQLSDKLLFCGGGSKSEFWMQMFADVFNMEIIKTNIDQDAASLGAACIAARSVGAIKDYSIINSIHHIESKKLPNSANAAQYEKLLVLFKHISDVASDLGDYMVSF